MERRKFLFQSGVLITAASFNAGFACSGVKKNDAKRPNPETFSEPVLKAIAYGVNATNPHNTQAWKFQLLSEHEMLFFVDETRLLTSTDPSTRQIHIGCGCFIECMKLGMQKSSFNTEIEIFPNKDYSRETIGTQPIARITFFESKNTQYEIITDSIYKRRTSRLKYEDVDIDNEAFDLILKSTKPKYSEISLINQPDKLNELLPILYQGMEVETFTYRTHDESRKWFRQNDDLIEAKRDGINLAGGGTTGFIKWIAEWQLKDLEASKWHNKDSNAIFLKNHKKKVMSSKGIVLLKTKSNNFKDWVYAGMDYMRLTLACTEKNYYMHPLSQVLQEFEEMEILRIKFEKQTGVSAPEKIQMAVRIGKSKEPYNSYRRHVSDFKI